MAGVRAAEVPGDGQSVHCRCGGALPLAATLLRPLPYHETLCESFDQVRKEVAREWGGLPHGAMWALRGNAENLKEEQRGLREQIGKKHGNITRALSIKECLASLWNDKLREDAEQHLESVQFWCSRPCMQPFVKLGKTLRRHMDGMLGCFKNYTTSAAIKAANRIMPQLARRRARDYRAFRNFQAMAYWIAGGLHIIDVAEAHLKHSCGAARPILTHTGRACYPARCLLQSA